MSETKAEVQQKHQQANVATAIAMKRYDAMRQLYDAAVFMRDGKEAETFRQHLHDLLDQILDASASALTLSRTLLEMADDPPPNFPPRHG